MTLQQVDANNGNAPTGLIKVNTSSDPDYVAPVVNTTACPVTSNLTCPADLVTSFEGTTLDFELSIANSVKTNPAINKIQVFAFNTDTNATEGLPIEFTAPFTTNYYAGQFLALGGTNYSVQIKYLNIANAVLQTC